MFPSILGGIMSPLSPYMATMGYINSGAAYMGAGSPNIYSYPGGQNTPFGMGKSIGDLFDRDPLTGRSKGNIGSAFMGLASLGLLTYSICNQFNVFNRLDSARTNWFPWTTR